MKRRDGLWLDLGPVILLTITGLAITLQPDNGDGTVIDTLVMPATVLPVFWWRRAPVAAATAIAIGMVVSGIPTFDQIRCGFALPGAMLILFSAAAREDRGRAWAALLAVDLGVVSLLFTDSVLDVTDGAFEPGALFPLVLCTAVWAAGRVFRARALMVRELDEQTRALGKARAETAQLAVEAERTRLAAVLDATVRDQLRSIVALAGPGSTTHPQRDARATFTQIEREARDSLHRMRQLLGLLHD